MAPAGVMLPPRVEQLSSHHDVGSFDCGEHPLNYFLRRYAAANQGARISNTYVAVEQGSAGVDISSPILGYYTLSLLSVSRDDLPADLVAQLPKYPIPAGILGRLAVDKKLHGQGLGTFLLFDSFQKVVNASQHIPIYALVVDAMFDHLVPWYKKYGFREFPNIARRLFISVDTLVKSSRP
jgi:predicted GNAT family N-acyltransferase